MSAMSLIYYNSKKYLIYKLYVFYVSSLDTFKLLKFNTSKVTISISNTTRINYDYQ